MINYSIVMRSVNANLKGRNATTANHKTFRAYFDNWLSLSGLLTHPTTIIKIPSGINKHKSDTCKSKCRPLIEKLTKIKFRKIFWPIPPKKTYPKLSYMMLSGSTPRESR